MSTNTISSLLSVGKIIRGRIERELPLAFSQCETLRFLEEGKSLTMRAIAAQCKIAAPSATAIVNELVRAGLVARGENTKDRREVLLHLTEEGKKMLRAVETNRKRIVSEVLSVLSEDDRKKLDAILGKIIVGTAHIE
jgi:DNA-binding MarR family transcriptional regulator